MTGGTATHGDDTTGGATLARVTLTTDQATRDAADPLADALRVASVAGAHRAFLPVPEDLHPRGALLLAADGPPLALTRLVTPASAPPGIVPALAAARGIGRRPAPATLQLKAAGVFISLRARDVCDLTQALDGFLAHLARLDMRHGERRLVYSEGAWRTDP